MLEFIENLFSVIAHEGLLPGFCAGETHGVADFEYADIGADAGGPTRERSWAHHGQFKCSAQASRFRLFLRVRADILRCRMKSWADDEQSD